jgi:hypothetical protein
MNKSNDDFQSNSVKIDSDELNQTGLDDKSYIIDDDEEDSLEFERQDSNTNKNDFNHNLSNHQMKINDQDAGFKLNHVPSSSSSTENTSDIRRRLDDVSLEFDRSSINSSSNNSKPPSFNKNVINKIE